MSLIIVSDEAEAGTTGLYTVPTGKTFLLVSAHLVLRNSSDGLGSAQARIFDDVPAIIDAFMLMKGPPQTTLSEAMVFSPPLALPEDYSIRAYSNGTNVFTYLSIMGYEI